MAVQIPQPGAADPGILADASSKKGLLFCSELFAVRKFSADEGQANQVVMQ